jgi:DNA-binding HxlR family transcriptional regulator
MAESSPDCSCCPHLHEAVELIGRRWTGAIIEVLRHDGPLRFSEIVSGIPGLSDRLCSERMKELEARGVVERTVHPGPPVRVEYDLTRMGRALGPSLNALQAWAQEWLCGDAESDVRTPAAADSPAAPSRG